MSIFSGPITANDIAAKSGVALANVRLGSSEVRTALGVSLGSINFADWYTASKVELGVRNSNAPTYLPTPVVLKLDNYILTQQIYAFERASATPVLNSGTITRIVNGVTTTESFSYYTYNTYTSISKLSLKVYDADFNYLRTDSLPDKYHQDPSAAIAATSTSSPGWYDRFLAEEYMYRPVTAGGDTILLQSRMDSNQTATIPRYSIFYNAATGAVLGDIDHGYRLPFSQFEKYTFDYVFADRSLGCYWRIMYKQRSSDWLYDGYVEKYSLTGQLIENTNLFISAANNYSAVKVENGILFREGLSAPIVLQSGSVYVPQTDIIAPYENNRVQISNDNFIITHGDAYTLGSDDIVKVFYKDKQTNTVVLLQTLNLAEFDSSIANTNNTSKSFQLSSEDVLCIGTMSAILPVTVAQNWKGMVLVMSLRKYL